VNFIAQIVRSSAERVDVAEILSQSLGQEHRNDAEILVMRPRQLSAKRLRIFEIQRRRQRFGNAWRERTGLL
jgi:hypothetical protein